MNLSGCQCEPADDPCHRLFTTVDDRGAFLVEDGVPELMQKWRCDSRGQLILRDSIDGLLAARVSDLH